MSDHLVSWDGPDDPNNPRNFEVGRQWRIAFIYGVITFAVTFASSNFSTATEATSKEYGVSPEVMMLGTALNVLGFAFGPLAFGPLSEYLGRKIPLVAGFLVFSIFNIPVAVASNLQTIFICRFFVGFGGSAPLSIVGGALVDLFEPIHRGAAVCLFSGATFVGTIFGPIIGSFVTESYLGWRWTAWLTLIVGCTLLIVLAIFVPETYPPVLLKRRAKALRLETGNWALHSEAEETRVSIQDLVRQYLIRPVVMLALEPILLLVTAYMSLIYGILYLTFEAYPIAFMEVRGWSAGLASLPFLGLGLGIFLGGIVVIVHNWTRYASIMKKHGDVPPEERLVPMMIGAFFLPAGLFWFAWTSDPHIIWVPQVVSGIFIGLGVMTIFIQGLSYIIDTYAQLSNSAVAANVFLRSWVGAGFVMFADGMYHNLGVDWATSLLAFISLALIPVPILFFIYGERIRKWSKFAIAHEDG